MSDDWPEPSHRDREKQEIEEYLSYLHGEWERTGNPLHVWDAIRFVEQYEAPPPWVMEYLQKVAYLSWEVTNDRPDLSEDSATKLIEEAIGLRRLPNYNAVQVMRKDESAQKFRALFLEEVSSGTPPHKLAGKLAERLGVSQSQVRSLRQKYDLEKATLGNRSQKRNSAP